MTQAHDLPGPVSYRAILHAALDRPPAERRRFLVEHLPPGPELDEAIALVEQANDLGRFLEQPRERVPEPFRPALPETIGEYRVLRLLGFGSNGVVYLAQQSAPDRSVALKLLRMDQATGAGADRFDREIALLARLSHPGIVPVFASGFVELGHGRQPWFAMEFVDGAPLNVFAEAAGLNQRGRIELVVEVARAVAYAHAQGVVHRDLKPENVLVLRESSSGASRVRVLDFGVARLVSESELFHTLTITGQVLGTLSYMAPEQARGGVIDARADQFALGAILFELLTGELPLAVRGRSTLEALRIVADGEAASASRFVTALAGDLEAILAMALASEPNRRYPSVADFADDLERQLAGRPTVARPPVALGRLVRLVRRHPLATLVVTALLVLAGIVSTIIVDARLDEARARRIAAWFEDLALVARLEEEVDTLWPIHSTRVDAMENWLRDAGGLEDRLERHRAALATLTSSASFPGSIATQGQALIDRIQGLAAPGGPVEVIRGRCARAAALLHQTVTARADEWTAARERVAVNPQYKGLALVPEEGLVPVGPDPTSGLEEFAAFVTGEVPVRSLEGDAIQPALGGALIFVLIPADDYSIGFDRSAYDPDTLPHNLKVDDHLGPPFVFHLDAYFISKFELTQDQYERISGGNPSSNTPGKTFFTAGLLTCTRFWGLFVELVPWSGNNSCN